MDALVLLMAVAEREVGLLRAPERQEKAVVVGAGDGADFSQSAVTGSWQRNQIRALLPP